jgi:DNA-directed RNA polymerase subunit H (RpoH/RPB5)
MSRSEVINLCNLELNCYLQNLPKIFDCDPQCIWIGAKVGDVVEIKMLSDIVGETMNYRVVIPKNGRIIAIKESKNILENNDNLEDVEEDDEVLEHVEHAKTELSEDDDDNDNDNDDIISEVEDDNTEE